MLRALGWVAVALTLAGCTLTHTERESFAKLSEEFVYTTLANSPVLATQVGYHRHGTLELDAALDDYSPEELGRQRRWLQELRLRLARSVDVRQLSPGDRADFDTISDQISLALLELETVQSYRHNPTLYVELIGNALYTPFVLEYSDKASRYRHIIARLEKIPELLRQARANLTSAPEIWTRTAKSENDGNIGLIEGELRSGVPGELRAEYDRAAAPALAALREFNRYLDTELIRRDHDWRLGSDKYGRKFRLVLATDMTPEQALAAAEKQLQTAREEMFAIARPIYDRIQPGRRGRAELNAVVAAVLADISGRHATPETYFADARRDLEEARAFVREKNLLTLPARDNLQVIETPEFMRGIYAVGGFNAAPPLQPELGAFYWITPIPKDWPADRIDSRLREYNYYGLKLLTIHEAVPGHYVQLEYANDVQPPLRRIIRSVFGNGPYVEGWAVYATELMLDEGYLDHSPELRLTFLKQQLRMIANTILDVRLQMMGMSDREALDLMIRDCFQEREEATAKLRRAKLSSA
ncbi:MAG TPA: DUF885 domain-containing protein, partial [Bryobacteraceae bacterium]|nr:DUF885 domain-containing protein [Bryobacteraceae bacterium]